MTNASAGCGNSILPVRRRRSASTAHMVFQIQLAKRQENVPLTRDYIPEREAELLRREAQRPAIRQAAE